MRGNPSRTCFFIRLAMEQFIDPKRYRVIPRTLIFMFHGEEILFIKKRDSAKWGGELNVIGGHIETGEDILTAAYRELLEETGQSGVELTYIGNIMIDVTDETGISLHIFKGNTSSKEIITSSEGELYWLNVDRLNEFPILDDIYDLQPLIYKWNIGNPLIIGHYGRDGKRNFRMK